MEQDAKSSKAARANRLASLRRMTRLSRQTFAKKYDISAGNFQNWEGPRYGGLTENGAKKIVKALRSEGIISTLEWLLHGVGEGPTITEKLYLDTKTIEQTTENVTSSKEASFIAQELLLFRKHYAETLETVIADDGMDPYYRKGEYVAGRKYYPKELHKLIDHDCIVETENNILLLRHLKTGSDKNLFTLSCNNINTTVTKPVLYDIELLSAAPAMWIRRTF